MPSFLNLPPPSPLCVIAEHRAELLAVYSRFPLAIYFTRGGLYTSMLLSVYPTLSFLCCIYRSILSLCMSIPVLQIGSSVYHFSRFYIYALIYDILVVQMVKNLPAMQETQVQSLGREDLLEKEMATHSSVLAPKIPWTEERGRLPSMGSQRVGHDWATSLSLWLLWIELLWTFLNKQFCRHLHSSLLGNTWGGRGMARATLMWSGSVVCVCRTLCINRD